MPGPTGPAGTGTAIIVQDEGNIITTGVTGINFTGSGVTATNVGDFVTVNIPGGTGSGSGIDTFGPTGSIATGATGIGLTGSGVSATSHSNGITTYTISGGGSSTTTGVYAIKLEFSGGTLVSTPFLAATDPNGNSLIGATGWIFARDSNNQITITHPQSKWFVNFNRFAQQSSGGTEWVSAAISGSSFSLNSVKNYTNQASFTIQALTTAQTGIAGSSTAYMFITWQEPSYNFYV